MTIKNLTLKSQEWQNDVDFYLDAEVTMPTPVNLTAYAYEFGTSEIWPVQHSIEALGGNRFHINISMPGSSTNNFDFFIKSENYGKVKLGHYGRGVVILGMQYQEGSWEGGHMILLSTTYHNGSLPVNHNVVFTHWGQNMCNDPSNIGLAFTKNAYKMRRQKRFS